MPDETPVEGPSSGTESMGLEGGGLCIVGASSLRSGVCGKSAGAPDHARVVPSAALGDGQLARSLMPPRAFLSC